IGLLEVPVSLHALIAERLDGLDPSELQLLRNASVLGKTFSIPALSAVAAIHENDLELRLDSLVQKEILGPPSSEGGPYSFLQDLVREVAHDRLSRQDRKALHLAAASYLSTGWGGHEDENVEVVSSHHLQAYRAAPEDVDAYEIKARAGEMLVRAGHRAASLAATEKAQRYFDQAAELADDSLTKAGILERAGEMALRGDRASQAEERFKQAISLFEAADQTHPAARVSARQAEVEWQTERLQDGIERMEKAFQVLRLEHPDEDLAALAVQLGRLYYHKGDKDLATERIEAALMIAESLSSTGALADALVTKGLILNARGRPQEALGVMKHALEVANRSDLPSVALRANRTLAFLSNAHDRFEEALVYSKRALDLARRLGDRRQEWRMLTDTTSSLWSMGRWDEALRRMAKIPNEYIEQTRFCIIVVDSAVAINLARGNLPEAERIFSLAGRCATAADVWERFTHLITHARILLAGKGKEAVALSKAEEALKSRNTLGMNPLGKAAFIQATHAAFALGKIDKVEQLLEMIEALPPGERSPLLEAQLSRFRARLAQVLGKQEGIVPSFEKAAGIFQELGTPFWRAVTLLEHGEWLHTWARRVDAEAILTEAKYLFQRLKARPFLERLERLHHSTVSV
ncbi:MAG: hypothetical protein ACRDJF_01050, partial [Actinomycetota bacterium]